MNSYKAQASIPTGYKFARTVRFMDAIPGWRRVVDVLAPPVNLEFTVQNGETIFSGNVNSFIDREIYLYGGYEHRKISKFISLIPHNRRRTILDVGANVGNHSTAFSSVFQNVHSFEPNPILWEQFQRNMELNQASKNVTLHRLGLSDRETVLTLHMIDRPNLGLGTFSTVDQYDLPLKGVATCQVLPGDVLVRKSNIGNVDAVKIDVQGFEPEVLRGLQDTLSISKPYIWLEIGAGTREQLNTMEDLKKLVPFGFKITPFAKRNFLECSNESIIPLGDYVLLPT